MQRFNLRVGSLGVIALVALGLTLWMLTGHFKHRDKSLEAKPAAAKGTGDTPAKTASAADAFKVQVQPSTAASTSSAVAVSGDTAPSRIVQLAGQAEGQVVALLARKGQRVKAGEVIVRLDPSNWALHRDRANASLRQAQLEYTAATRLRETGYVTEGELAAKFAALQSSKAQLADAEYQLKHLTITAPVSGVIEEQPVEVGNYVRVGEMVVKILVNDPLRVMVNVSETDVPRVKVGAPASALVAGQTLKGSVEFISAMADAKTRTFAVAVAVDNPGSALPAGLSAQVTLPSGSSSAHRLPASLLSLGDDGALGVKHVGSDGKAIFTPVRILKADGDAVWVGGLPEQIQLITQGQGFIKAGELVPVTVAPAPQAKS